MKVNLTVTTNYRLTTTSISFAAGFLTFTIFSAFTSFANTTITIVGYLDSFLLLNEVESFDRLYANYFLNISVAKTDDDDGIHFFAPFLVKKEF